MAESTLLFVHGTGVRGDSCGETVSQIKLKAAKFQLPCQVDSCHWGDIYDAGFEGLSLPEPPARSPSEKAQAERWEYLQIDPLFDLRLWCTPAGGTGRKVFGEENAAVAAWEGSIEKYASKLESHVELVDLLEQNQIKRYFVPAWDAVVLSGLPKRAFEAAGAEGSAVLRAFAEAVAAQMIHDAAAGTPPVAIPPSAAGKIAAAMLSDWGQETKGLKDLFVKFFGAATKTIVRPLRAGASRAIAPAIGDILYYQSKGKQIRELIAKKIGAISGDAYVLAHSLGGIACFELLVEARRDGANGLPSVKGLITAGSQAPLLYELDALQELRKGRPLPDTFPEWLNLYDENDLLSYRANLLFDAKPDKQVDSMLPPLEAHSAYWQLDETWLAIGEMMKKSNG